MEQQITVTLNPQGTLPQQSAVFLQWTGPATAFLYPLFKGYEG
jgi:hypothetical protein